MTEIKVEVAHTNVANLPYPPWEDVTEKVKSVSHGTGRDYELDDIDVGTASVNIEVDREDETFKLDTTAPAYSDDYLNGFSHAATHHMSVADKRYDITFDSVFMASNPTPLVGTVETVLYENSGTEAVGWYLSDELYWAPVQELEEYVFGYVFKEPDKSGPDAVFKDQAYATWYTDKSIRIQSDRFSYVDTPNSTADLQVKGKLTAPVGAAFVTIGSTPFKSGGFSTSTKGYRTLRWSSLQVHKYDAVYEAANGGNYLKPFDVDELFDHAVDGGTPVRVVSPGNQFTMNKWFPSQMIGSGTRPRNPYNIMQSAYDMEALTSGTIANWFTQNRCTLSVNTSTAFTGAQSLGVVTNSANGNPVELYFTIGTATMWTPIQPLQRYRIGFAINNTGAGSAVFQLRYKHDININSEAAQVGTTTKLAGGGWTHYTVDWTAPAGIYGAFFLLRFNAAGYTLAIDDITIECLEVEPDIGDNLMPYWGDFETLDTLSMKLESISGSGSDYSIIDDASIAASGRRFGSLLKPSGTGAVNLVLGSYYGHAHSYTDGGTSGRAYKLKFKARTSVSITGTVAPLYKHNDTAHNGAFGNLTAKNLSTSWTEYEYDIVVPAGLTSTLLGFTFTGTSGTTASMYFDDVRLEKFPSGINEALSTVGPGLERTTIYDAELTLGHVFYMYGNDEIHDARYVRQTYHSGKTRTRFKMTMTSAGHDFGGTADLYWVEVLGHTRRNAIGNDFPDYYASRLLYDSPITLPTSGSPTTINVLAPDIPDVAYVPMIIFYDSNGPQTFGYTFTDEYIGPDGYEDDPEVLERVWFRGLVEQRRDTFASMGIDDKRVLKVDLDCVDLMGTLQSVELDTPYNSVVFRDKPMAYFTFNDDPTREIGELAGRTEVRASIATIGPASDDYGVKAASDVELLAGSEGGSYKISPEDGTFNGGSVIFKERTWSEAVINGGAFECWFRSGIPSGDWDSPKILATQYMASNASVECGISIWLNENDVYFGWGYGTQFGSYAGYNTTLYDGESHHILVTHDASILYLYIDGILRSTYDQIAPELPHDTTSIGGWNGEGINSTMNGWVSHVAFYDRYLSASEAETHYLVGKFAGLGDDEVARLNYILDVARVSGVPSTVKDRDGNRPASATTLDYMNWSSGASPVSELKACAFTDAGGLIYAQGNDIVYEPRQTRWNRGMHVASWEVGSELIEPQLPISSNPDVSKIVNEITITRQSDADLKVVNVLSQKKYRRAAKSMNINTETLEDAKYRAQWIVRTTGEPMARYGSINFKDIRRNGEFCRDVRISDYLYGTFSNVNGIDEGVIDHFIESVEHHWYRDGLAIQHIVTIEVSPAGTKLAFILDDPVYGVLDDPSLGLGY